MKRVTIAFALSAALLAFSSPEAVAPESPWVAFAFRGGEEGYGPASIDPLIQVAGQGATTQDSILLDEQTTIALEEGSLTVLHQGQEVWHSDPSWDVRQLLLADVNNDGKEETAFVLWKPFSLEPAIIYDTFGFPSLWEEGSLRNHLFLYGWRDASWQHLWCSSPVADPIVELAVGDVNGDGANELVVLEGSYDSPDGAAAHVSVWGWNGWGFTLQWRSPPGVWERLVLQDVTDDGVLDILVKEPS
jgi:hypothetical protein